MVVLGIHMFVVSPLRRSPRYFIGLLAGKQGCPISGAVLACEVTPVPFPFNQYQSVLDMLMGTG